MARSEEPRCSVNPRFLARRLPIEKLSAGPILELAIRDALFPADDVLTGAEAEVGAEAAARKAAAKQAKAEKKAARSEQQ